MQFSLLIKPASADCNLRCDYCFYLDRAELYPQTAVHRMSDDVLERLVKSYLATPQPVYSFVWQGGEPLLMGSSFYERVTDLQLAFARRGAEVSNALQTNGMLLTDRLARQFRACRFLTGVSLDGPERLHDAARRDRAGRGSHRHVLEGLDCLKRNQAEYNVLTLVNSRNASSPVEIYDYLVSEVGAKFLQFIECVELDRQGRAAPYCVTAQEWGSFLCAVFDRWFEKDTRTVSVRLFDTIIAKLVTGQDICCTAGLDCRQYFVVEYNGDVYPCDFHVLPELRLGNIMTHTWEELADAEIFKAFGERKRQTHAACAVCPYFSFCAGDCPKNRVGHSGGAATALSYLCGGWKAFYEHALPRLERLAKTVRAERQSERN
jgi:uncharacterized protein